MKWNKRIIKTARCRWHSHKLKQHQQGYETVKSFAEPVNQLLQSSSVFPTSLTFTNQRRVGGEYYSLLHTSIDLRRYFVIFKLEMQNNYIITYKYITNINGITARNSLQLCFSCNSLFANNKCKYLQESCAITKMTAQCALWVPWKFSGLPESTATISNVFIGFCSGRPYECSYKIWSP